ncbi:aldo/keto reductase [Corynebacterium sp. CCM 9203]|uniref:aldo/keto reductase n=1 Tax=Corynebacterium sp. CCM 9203 TaxID=3057615 RepID=UPI0035254749
MTEKTFPTTVTLNDGNEIPQLGFGVYKLKDDDCVRAVRHAIDVGYRHIDTAAIYGNEEQVGNAIRDAVAAGDVTREELFITTKVWNDRHGADETARAFQESLSRLGLDYVDCYLVHWPCPRQGLAVDTFREMAKIQGLGGIRSIGVSNFYAETLDEIISATGITPVLNQIELHPGFSQPELRGVNRERGIATEAWSPIGRGRGLDHPVITRIAAEQDRTPAQVMLRWHLQLGNIVIPKSANPKRISENFDIFDFHLAERDVESITALDDSAIAGRIGPDPLVFPED